MIARKIEKEDNEVIASIIRTVLGEFDANPKTTILGDPSLDKMFEKYQSPRSVYFIVENNNIVAGGCGIRQLDNSDENICELQRMFLLPSFRGKGYGKLLIELCLNKAKEFKYDKIYLETLSQMHKAIQLYTRAGFIKLENPLGHTGHSGCNMYMSMELSG